MNKQLVAVKLESLRRCVVRVEEKSEISLDELKRDPDLHDVLVLNLTRAVQVSVDIASHLLSGTEESAPQTVGEAFSSLARIGIIDEHSEKRMRNAVGFRNVAIHTSMKRLIGRSCTP